MKISKLGALMPLFLMAGLLSAPAYSKDEGNPFIKPAPIAPQSNAVENMPIIGSMPMAVGPSSPPPGTTYVGKVDGEYVFFNSNSKAYIYRKAED